MRKRLLIFFCLGVLLTAGGVPGARGMDGGDFDAAGTLMTAGRYADAVTVYRHISTSTGKPGDRAQALLLEGTAQCLFLGRPEEALACFSKVLFDYPGTAAAPDALFQSGIIYYGQGRFGLARDAFSTYRGTYPQGVRYASATAWLSHVASKADAFPIRILVADRADQLFIRSEAAIIVRDIATGRRVGPKALSVSIRAEAGKLFINGFGTAVRQVRITSAEGGMTLGGCRSRGEYIVSATVEGLQAVNQVPLEQYLYGIIPREMPCTWSHAALMAQAVASRTYGLYICKQNSQLPYDVRASVASQVYGGIDSERAATSDAVDATRGQVMTFDGRLIAAYFHADSGGHTEDARYVWDVDIPYLKGAPDSFSDNISGSNWQCHLTFGRIADKLSAAGVALGAVHAIRILETSPTGRVLKLQVVSDTGVAEVNGNHFRLNIGPTCIKSTCFQVTCDSEGAFFSGKGYGHGVGMSQWGAERMAATGFTYRQILEFYYPGTTIADAAVACGGL